MIQAIIDHNSPLGFECVAEARQYLLDMGAREVEDPATDSWDVRGSHVAAPVGFYWHTATFNTNNFT